MNSNSFLKLAKNVNELVYHYKYRPKDYNGKPGGLIEIPKDIKPIIVGDLHGCANNLKSIVEENTQDIINGKSILLIVGDALHNDQNGKMLEMKSSLECLDLLFELISRFPNKVIYIRGNHDTFDERLRKSHVKQGLEFKNYLLEQRNAACVNEVERFFISLPMAIIGQEYVVTHAGPVRNGLTREELINIADNQNKYMQLIWTRIHEFRGNPSQKEYDENDIRSTLEKLKLPQNTHFIVGHNPLWHTGNTSGVWIDVLGIKNHHIIYSNFQTNAPYLTFENNKLKVKFAIKTKPEALYV